MYVRNWQCSNYLGTIFLIETTIYVFICVLMTKLKLLKLSITSTPYVLISLPCMASPSFTLILFIGWFRHIYSKFSRMTIWIWLFCFKYLLSFILLVFWFRRSDSNSEIWYIFQIHLTEKKPLYTDPHLLRQWTFCNCHHGSQLIATHYIVFFLI